MGIVLNRERAPWRFARLVSELTAPAVLVVLVLLVVGTHAAGVLRGLAMGGVAIFFAGVLPYGLLLFAVRRGLLTDRHVSRREQRPPMMAAALISVVAGLLVLRHLDAPVALLSLVAAMAIGLGLAFCISSFWKLSVHAASAAGTVASLAALVNSRWLLLAPLVVVTGWARVELRAHTRAQVAVGAVIGVVVALGVPPIIV